MIEWLAPAGLVALVAVPLIAYLYTLKPRRQTVSVSSNELWLEVLKARQHGLGLRRLLRNLSLLLLLLTAALLAIAAGIPQWLSTGSSHSDTVFVLDTSASMQARSGSNSRIEIARQLLRERLGQMPANARAMLVTSARDATVRTAFETNLDVVRRALADVQVTDESGHPGRALALANTVAAGATAVKIVWLTDQAGNVSDLPVMDNVEVVPVGDSARNVAITQFAVRLEIGTDDRYQALVALTNYNDTPTTARLNIKLAAASVFDRKVTLAPRATDTLVVPFVSVVAGDVEAELVIDDDFSADNHAYAVLGAERASRVALVTQGNFFLNAALDALPQLGVIELADTSRMREADVVILDNVTPPKLVPGNYFALGAAAAAVPVKLGPASVSGELRAVTDSALMAGLDLGNLYVRDARALTLRPDLTTDAQLRPLIVVDGQVVAGALIAPNWRVVVFGFDPTATRLPLRAAWPLLLGRGVTWLAGHHPKAGERNVPAGVDYQFDVPRQTRTVRAVAPDGVSSDVRVDDGVALFSATRKVGLYRFEAGGQFHSIAVNLLDRQESDLARRALPETGPSAQLAIDEDAVAWPMWPWLALAALLALLSEWSLRAWRRGYAS